MKNKKDIVEKNKITSLIESIKYARTPQELAYLVSCAEAFISQIQDPSLKSSLNNQLDKVEESRDQTLDISRLDANIEQVSVLGKSGLEFAEQIFDKPEFEDFMKLNGLEGLAINLASSAIISSIENNKDIFDTSSGQAIQSFLDEKAKMKNREDSKIRVDALKNISDNLNRKDLTEKEQNDLIKDAASVSIKILKDPEGKIHIDQKGQNALEKISKLDMQKVKKIREERKAKDGVDNLSEALELGPISFLFPDTDDLYETKTASKSKTDKQSLRHDSSIPETVRSSSPEISYEQSYSSQPQGKNSHESFTKKIENQRSKNDRSKERGPVGF